MSTTISNENIKRLSIKSGILYLSEDVYDEIRNYIIIWLQNISKKISTLNITRLLEKHILFVLPYNTVDYVSINKCDYIDTYKTKNDIDKKLKMLSKYDYQYKNLDNNCLLITKTTFKRIFSNILNNYTSKTKQFGENSLELLQMNLEYNIVELLVLANKLKDKDRKTLMSRDIYSAIKIKDNNNTNEYLNYLSIDDNIKFNLYIKNLLKTVHPDINISKETLKIIDLYLKLICYYIIKECKKYSTILNIKTLTSSLISKASYIILDGEINEHAQYEMMRTIKNYKKYNNIVDDSKKISKATKAQIIFQPSKIRNIVENFWNNRISDDAIVGLTGIIEYVCLELLELSGNNAIDNKRKTIKVKNLYQAIKYDNELDETTKNINLVFPGMKPFVENPYKTIYYTDIH
jgi:histone H3/H4